MNTANTTPNPATVTIPPPCASIAAAPPVLTTVPADAVLVLVLVLFLPPLAVEVALLDAEAAPDPFVEFDEPVAPEPLADLVPVAEAVELPAASVAFEALDFEDWVLLV